MEKTQHVTVGGCHYLSRRIEGRLIQPVQRNVKVKSRAVQYRISARVEPGMWVLPQHPGCARAGLGSARRRCWCPAAGCTCTPLLQHPTIFNLAIAQSSLQWFLSSVRKLSLLFWFKSSGELSELKINHAAVGNAEPPGSRKHLFLFSARRGKSAFRIMHGNFDCHFASPHPAYSHFNFQK